ncbi:AraC family transcriptional regulator [Sphingobacterium humi]|uniref:Helix-turn-helix domain-containing protein n=1 Tax=Sphingobacterium humi TaxID=1796905 RepID=A0A6N8L4H7_9SPHI|nr:helix-turn-helix domain-containing protein [Sphingobacterium humi]MVZ63929.1 helix-turn-helix domain-containing protein [Sphingobacterium humi]
MVNIIIFASILIISCFNLQYSLRLPRKTSVSVVLLIFSSLAGFHATYACVFRIIIPDLIFLDLGAPMGLLYGPLLHQLFLAAEKNARLKAGFLLELIPFFLFFSLYMVFICSGDLRHLYTAVFIKYLYSAFSISWLIYPILILYRSSGKGFQNQKQYQRYYIFSMLMLMAASFEIPFVLKFDFQYATQQQHSSSYFVFMVLLVAVILVQIDFKKTWQQSERRLSKSMERLSLIQQQSASPKASIERSQFSEHEQEKILDYLAKQPYLDANFSFNKMKKDLRLSPQHLQHLFLHLFNHSFLQTINKLRIGAVCSELEKQNSNLAIVEIAYNCGFNSRASFYRYFRKEKKCSPIEYRARMCKRRNETPIEQ